MMALLILVPPAYAMDLRGMGKSDGERMSVDSFEDCTRDLKTFIDMVKEHEGRNVFLLGLGGGIVLRYATEHPEDLEGTVATAPGLQLFGLSIPLIAARFFILF